MKKVLLLVCVFTTMSNLQAKVSFADSSATGDIKEAGRDLKKGTRRAARAVKDKTCPLVNGKVDCAMKKGGHKVENVIEDVKDKADDTGK